MISSKDKFINYLSENRSIDFIFLDELILSFELLNLVVFSLPNSTIIILMKGKTSNYCESGRFIFYSKPIERKTIESIFNNTQKGCNNFSIVNNEEFLIGNSLMMSNLRKELKLLAKEDCPILLYGKSGTGKELAAKMLHGNSKYYYKESVNINCSLLNSDIADSILFGHRKGSFTGAEEDTVGLIEKANETTLFLDEIENISIESQSKLLRTIELGEYRKIGDTQIYKSQFRLISASNKDLNKLVEQKIFRDDFYFRISLIQVRLPSLNEHKEDIEELVLNYYQKKNEKRPLEKGFIKKLEEEEWPGNVRQLFSVLEKSRIYSSSSIIRLKI